MNAMSEIPRTTPTMQDRTVTRAKSARPCWERGSRSREMRPNMSVSFRGRAHAPHVRVVGELVGRVHRDDAARVKDGDLVDAGDRRGTVRDDQDRLSPDEAGEGPPEYRLRLPGR